MTQPVAAGDQQSGSQQQSTGLVVHRGQISSALLRVIGTQSPAGPLYPRDGAGAASGLELVHVPGSYSQVQSYDREKAQWLDLYLNAKILGLNTQTNQPVKMPAGSAQALLGSWLQPSGYTTP